MYWRYRDYIGIGPGAHGRFTIDGKKFSTRAHRAPEMWLDMVSKANHGAHPFEDIDLPKRGREMLMMGLRLPEGIDLTAFRQETGSDFSDFVNQKQATMLVEGGFIELSSTSIKATASGRQRLNSLLGFLLA